MITVSALESIGSRWPVSVASKGLGADGGMRATARNRDAMRSYRELAQTRLWKIYHGGGSPQKVPAAYFAIQHGPRNPALVRHAPANRHLQSMPGRATLDEADCSTKMDDERVEKDERHGEDEAANVIHAFRNASVTFFVQIQR